MFIAQSTLEAWTESGHADVTAETVRLHNARRAYLLEAAVRFLSVVPESAGTDLLGKVLTEARILELGGELLGDSVLFGEAAFQVESGFVGTLRDGEGAA